MSLKAQMDSDMSTFFDQDDFAESALIDGVEVSVLQEPYFDESGIPREAVCAPTSSVGHINDRSKIKLGSDTYHITSSLPEPGDESLTIIILGAKV